LRFILLITLIVAILLISCNTSTSLFRNKSPHEQYAEKLSSAGLKGTALGKKWFSAAETAFAKAAPISLPYRVVGYFPVGEPASFSVKFKPTRGEKLIFQLTKNPARNFNIFCDLWELRSSSDTKYLSSIDTSTYSLEFDVSSEDSLLLRLQPELLSSGEYTLTISVAPSLAFPVAHPQARIASFWGASRDAGARSHEGIDIFAPRGTPVVAAADGYVGSVTVNNLGGNVVFMRPEGKNYSLYYAHLDTQIVTSGERVKSGDTLGTVGNTGNARTTPPHLHFGIYTSAGAINPLPFVEPGVKNQKTFTVDSKLFVQPAIASNSIVVNNEKYSKGTPVTVVAATDKDYTIVLPDGCSGDAASLRCETTDW
jgi:murein DD-endopeptidase MepM/ murein hydrolase activator NlpD